MDFHFTSPQTSLEEFFGGFFCINAIGKIEQNDDIKFEKFLKLSAPPPRCVVYIDSTGGDVDTAINIGRTIRESWFHTDVGQYRLDTRSNNDVPIRHRTKVAGKCLSAATLMFLGGRLRFFDDNSMFGVHQFDFPSAQGPEVPRHFLAKSQALSARISEYVSDMGISQKFLLLTAQTPPEKIQYVGKSELESIGIITGGATGTNWTLEANHGLSYIKGERDSIYGHHKVMLCFKKEVGFYFWSVIETQGRTHELLNHGLVEIVINGEKTRIDISSRAERFETGIYMNIFSPISDDEAKLISFSESFGLQIRFCSHSEVFLGVGAMDTTDGKMKLRTFYENHKK